MMDAKKGIIRAQERLRAHPEAGEDLSGIAQKQQQQIESYLQMAKELAAGQYTLEGATALVSMVKKWQAEAIHQQAQTLSIPRTGSRSK